MSAFHAPAPWKVNANGGAITVTSRDGHTVAVLGHPGFDGNDGRLIAAAPETLDALRELFRMVEEGVLVRNVARDAEPGWASQATKLVMALKHASAALEKVDGETPPTPRPHRLRCPSCGDFAIDGKVTCGRVECGSSTGADR